MQDIEEQVRGYLETLPLDGPLYDDSPDPYSLENNRLQVMPGLSSIEKQEALMLHRYSKGLMIVSGEPGQGKGLFSNTLAWKMKRYFGKPVILDYIPRRAMGYYKLFDVDFFVNEMAKMHEASRGINLEERAQMVADTARRTNPESSQNFDRWMAERGKVQFQNSVLVLDEFWRYMDKRRPMTNMNKYIGGLIRYWRHLDILIIGVTQNANDDLDPRRCLPYVSHDVRCQWCMTRPHTTIAQIYPMKFVSGSQVIQVTSRPFQMIIDGNKPRPALDGQRYFDLFSSKNVGSIVTASNKIEL